MSYAFNPNDYLNDSQDALLANHAAGLIKHYVFPAGIALFKKNEPRQCAFLVNKGKVEIYGNDEGGEDKLLCVLGEGEIFGEMALIDGSNRSATAITASEAHIFVIPRDALHDRFRGLDPMVSLLMSLLIERYRVSRVNLPESVKQDDSGQFADKIRRYDKRPQVLDRLRDADRQRDIALQEMKLEQDIRQGLEHKQFIPVLQPILNLPDERIAGFEALVRWHHPDKGIVSPFEFIPAAERSGLVQNIDRSVLEQACMMLPDILKAADGRIDNLFVSVNLSGINFGDSSIVERIKTTLENTQADPRHIKLEITESALIGEPERAEDVLLELRDLGFRIALDDFGTGYSSLGYLHKFSIDDLKIDRSFVSQIHDSKKGMDIVRAIIAMARTFDLNVVAEGIETERDVIAMNGLDCDMAQGYHYAKPLECSDAIDYLKTNLAL